MSKLQLTQEQKLAQRLSLELQRQLGTVLEKNDAELSEYIDNKVDEIPALEKVKDSEPDPDAEESNDNGPDRDEDQERGEEKNQDDAAGKDDADEGGTDNKEEYQTEPDTELEVPEREIPVDEDDDSNEWSRYMANNRSADDEHVGPIAVAETSLMDFLLGQLGELQLDELKLDIAREIVGSLEDDGYMRCSIADIERSFLNKGIIIARNQIEEALAIVQKLDPPGIAARDLKECIRLQLERKPDSEDVQLAIKMVDTCFDLFASGNFAAIANRLKISAERARQVFEQQIRHGINPRPGGAFSSRSDNNQQLTPDFQVEWDENTRRLTVTLCNNIPELQISESFALQVERYKSGVPLSVKEQKEKKTIVDAYQRASTFIEVLRQRQETLFKTMEAIVKCQAKYFESGDERDLCPLGQQQIAEMIGKDVSVVSRAVNNKYVQLPWGVKSLKSFFSEDINGMSRHQVYDDLKKLVDAEDKSHPLSDDALCSRLKEMGYKLERRTVAKYREQLKIPSSTQRRKMSR